MRTSFVALAGSLLLSACVSGTRVVYVPVPADGSTQPAPAPAPVPPPVEVAPPPVAVTIVRADEGRLLVSLDQPAYLAVFDIVPGRGVTMLYPASARQRQVAIVGARWLDPRWGTLATYDIAAGGRLGRGRSSSVLHYVYAVASERPLRITDGAFDDGLLAGMLGTRMTRAEDPYDARDAIVRQFVTVRRDEDWGEDMYTMDAMRPVQTVRVARVYCADGSVIYVREELADRAYCPRNPSGRVGNWKSRPDSVVAWNGRPVPHSQDPNSRTPVYRVPRQVGGHVIGRPSDVGQNGSNGQNANSGNNGNSSSNGSADNGHTNNGNHYGWQNGNNGNNGNAAGQATGNQAQGGVQQQGHPQDQPHGNPNGQPQGNAPGNSPGNAPGNSQNNPPANGHGKPGNARPAAQPAPPAAVPDTARADKPTVQSVLDRGFGKKPAPAKKTPAKPLTNRVAVPVSPDSAKPAPVQPPGA